MDPQAQRVGVHTDPDRVATMYGELGNKLVRVLDFEHMEKNPMTDYPTGPTCKAHPSPRPSPTVPDRDRPRRDSRGARPRP